MNSVRVSPHTVNCKWYAPAKLRPITHHTSDENPSFNMVDCVQHALACLASLTVSLGILVLNDGA